MATDKIPKISRKPMDEKEKKKFTIAILLSASALCLILSYGFITSSSSQSSDMTTAKSFMRTVMINEGALEGNILEIQCSPTAKYGAVAFCVAPVRIGVSKNISFYTEIKGYVNPDDSVVVWVQT